MCRSESDCKLRTIILYICTYWLANIIKCLATLFVLKAIFLNTVQILLTCGSVESLLKHPVNKAILATLGHKSKDETRSPNQISLLRFGKS